MLQNLYFTLIRHRSDSFIDIDITNFINFVKLNHIYWITIIEKLKVHVALFPSQYVMIIMRVHNNRKLRISSIINTQLLVKFMILVFFFLGHNIFKKD